MKAFILLMAMFVSLNTFATQFQYQPVSQNLAKLTRHFKFVLNEKEYEVGVIENDSSAVYYSDVSDDFIYAQVYNGYNTKDLELNIIVEKTLYTFDIKPGFRVGVLKGIKRAIKRGREMITSNNELYWFSQDDIGSTISTAEVMVISPLFTRESVSQHIQVTGPMNYRPCDGCEHGDQMFIQNVNVVNMDFGQYYTVDCEGTLVKLFERLISEKLNVPFTYRGRVNFDSGDIMEDFENHLVADHLGGQLYIGHTTKLPFRLFVDSLIHRSAFMLGVEVASIEKDVINRGKFTYADGILTFTYRSLTIKTNLLTGQTL